MADRENIVPEPTCVVHPTTSTKKRAKRSSKAVRHRKSGARRITLNKFTQERVRKSLKINIVQIDDGEMDFTDVFAFFTWYQENYARLEEVPKLLAIQFRDHYIALNVPAEQDEWLRGIIQHKFLFDDCYYEKLVNSDSDESVFDEVHKTDQMTVADSRSTEIPRSASPTYRAESPTYAFCNTTDYSGSSDDTSGPTSEDLVFTISSDRIRRSSSSIDSRYIMDDDSAPSDGTILYKDLGARRLCAQMTEDDYKDIENKKRQLLKRTSTSNVKIRYGLVTLYLTLDNLRYFYKSDCDPIVSISNRSWDVRETIHALAPQIVVRPRDERIVRVVAMG